MPIDVNLLDEDGENLAVRCFLVGYPMYAGSSMKEMRGHMRDSGYPHWPNWVTFYDGYLTKSGAQSWLRHLFALETMSPVKSENT